MKSWTEVSKEDPEARDAQILDCMWVYVYKFDKYGPFILSGENESLHLSAVDLFPAANPKLVGKTAWFVQKHRLERVQSPPMDIDGYGDDCIKNSSKKKNRNLGENTNVITHVFRTLRW